MTGGTDSEAGRRYVAMRCCSVYAEDVTPHRASKQMSWVHENGDGELSAVRGAGSEFGESVLLHAACGSTVFSPFALLCQFVDRRRCLRDGPCQLVAVVATVISASVSRRQQMSAAVLLDGWQRAPLLCSGGLQCHGLFVRRSFVWTAHSRTTTTCPLCVMEARTTSDTRCLRCLRCLRCTATWSRSHTTNATHSSKQPVRSDTNRGCSGSHVHTFHTTLQNRAASHCGSHALAIPLLHLLPPELHATLPPTAALLSCCCQHGTR